MRGRGRAGPGRAARRRRAGDAGARRRAARRRASDRAAGRACEPPTATRAGCEPTRSRRGRARWSPMPQGTPVDVARALPGRAVPLGRHDRGGDRLLRARPHGVPAARAARSRATPTSRRRPARPVDEPEPGDLVTYGEDDGRPHRLLARWRPDPALDRPGRWDRRGRGGRAGLALRARRRRCVRFAASPPIG